MWEEPRALPVLGLERERERKEIDRQGEKDIKTDRGGRERKIERDRLGERKLGRKTGVG